MKINRFVALAAIALLVVGVMGAVTFRTFAQGDQPPVASDCGTEVEDDDAAEAVESGPDTDEIQDECGNQSEDGANEANEANEANDTSEANEASEANDTAEANEANEPQESAEADQATLQSKATISAADAEAIALKANPGASVVKTELDEEQGIVIYDVELDNGQDVSVDAATGEILVESGE